jgi:carboxylesterase type B
MMHSCWVNFAKTGAPSCEGVPEWPRYTEDGDSLMELGLSPRVRQGFRKAQLDAQEAAWRAGAEEEARRVEEEIRRLEESGLGAPR